MSRRLVLLLSILLFIALACNLSDTMKLPKPSHLSSLDRVYVAPSVGGPEFTVYLEYLWNLADPVYSITCTHPGRLGGTTKTVDVPVNHGNVAQFTFTVTELGSYNVRCQDSAGNSISSVFTVEAGGSSEPPNGGSSSGQSTTTGKFNLSDYSQVRLGYTDLSAWTNESGGQFSIPNWCLPSTNQDANNSDPPLTLATDGSLHSTCVGSMSGSIVQQWQGETTATVTDSQDGALVSWEMHMTITRYASVTDMGKFATLTASAHGSADVLPSEDGSYTARGTAEWTYTCNTPGSNNDGYPQCGDYQNTPDQATWFLQNGTLEWKMDFIR